MYRITTGIFRSLAVLAFAFSAAPNIATGGNTGMDVLAMGGGSIDSVTFQTGTIEDISFSFFAGYDKDGNPDGSFHFKRGYANGGISAILSTEITNIEKAFDSEKECPLITMTGIAKLIPNWAPKPAQGQKFILKVWDCDSSSNATDMIWFEVRRSNDSLRRGLSLLEPAMSLKGNILIQ